MKEIFLSSNFIFTIICVLIKSILICLTYYITDKKNSVNRSVSQYTLIFLFGDLYILFDAYKQLKSKEKTISKAIVVVLCVSIISTFIINSAKQFYNSYNSVFNSNVSNSETQNDDFDDEIQIEYYDRYGNLYNSPEEVIYYTYDGAEFKYDIEEGYFNCIKNTNNLYPNKCSDSTTYVDENGWIVLYDKALPYSEDGHGDFCYYDEENSKYYASVFCVEWKKSGTMYFNY